MTKETILKQFYISQITQLAETTKDISLLDLIYRLLTNQLKEEKQ